MLRGSLKNIIPEGIELPEEFATERPEQLSPEAFVRLTKLPLYRKRLITFSKIGIFGHQPAEKAT